MYIYIWFALRYVCTLVGISQYWMSGWLFAPSVPCLFIHTMPATYGFSHKEAQECLLQPMIWNHKIKLCPSNPAAFCIFILYFTALGAISRSIKPSDHKHLFIKMFHLLFLQLCENVSIVILISPIYRSRIVQLRIHVDIVYTISSGSHGLRFSTRFKACSYQRLLTNLCRFESVQS